MIKPTLYMGNDVYESVKWKKVDVEIKDYATGEVIYEGHDLEFPEDYSQQACDIIASKYFFRNIDGNGTPETSLKQVVHRMACFWTEALIDEGLLDDNIADKSYYDHLDYSYPFNYYAGEAGSFYDDVVFSLIHQLWAPNSPQWFNTGICYYGIEGDADGFWYCDSEGPHESEDRYKRSQSSACFIIPIEDRLIGDDSITDHYVTETKLFKGGSGVGTNFSTLRAEGEKLSSGGESSGVMSFLLGLDRNAGAIKSGGTTRRAAKMVILNIDHPDIEEFIDWKVKEEKKARDLISLGYDGSMGGEAYSTVSGQNSNNSVRVTREFMHKVLGYDEDPMFELKGRVDEDLNRKVNAHDLWDKIAKAAWECADPGIQFDDRYNEWNTVIYDGRINATNPCSEFAFLDNSACNLASINLLSFYDDYDGKFDYETYTRVITLCQYVLEASIHWGHYPTEDVAVNSYKYRPTGLGFANLGALLLKMGYAYDSTLGRDMAKDLAGILTAQSYITSADMASLVGPCEGYEKNSPSLMEVLDEHLNNTEVRTKSRELFSRAINKVKRQGVRNMQVTVMAPTGTISLAMDCATTGIEPVFSHKMYKKCADGSVMEIVNPLVEDYLLGYNGADLDENDYEKVKKYFDDNATYQGCPELGEEGMAVLATANEITPEGHVLMMAAIQPMISGSISKTVNLPNSATVEDIKTIYELAYTLGCKSISIYRDGCKGVQPLNVSLDDDNQSEAQEEDLDNPGWKTFTDYFTDYCMKNPEALCGGVDLPHTTQINKPVEVLFNIEDDQTFCVRTENNKTTICSNAPVDYYVFEDCSEDDDDNEANKELQALLDGETKNDYFMGIDQPEQITINIKDGQKVTLNTFDDMTDIGSNMPLDFTVPNEETKGETTLERKKPNGIRTGRTHTFKIGDVELYITVSYYENGDLCELFVSSDREGTTTKGLLSSLSKSISHMLQYGIPPENIATMLRNQQYEPAGHVERHPYIKMASSISDIIARVIEFENGDYSRCQVSPLDNEDKPNDSDEPVQINITVSADPADLDLIDELKYTGGECPICHSKRLVQNGTCELCLDCGSQSSCG